MHRKILYFLFALVFISCLAATAIAKDISLFDSDGNPVAYIDTDDEMTIYLWSGKPVAYLETNNKEISIYGFNGKHQGWFKNGIIWGHDGYAVGFIEGAASKITKLEPFKGFKEFKPFKSFKEFEPLKPIFVSKWSRTPLLVFLTLGNED